MPEPDFDQIARDVADVGATRQDVEDIVDALRNVWNARGAADIGACSACRWWKRVGSDWGECQLAMPEVITVPPEAQRFRVAVDYNVAGYSGQLTTRHDFGCVQWERKADA